MRKSSVNFLTPPLEDFESEYSAIRQKEGRWLTDVEVQQLPHVPQNHPLFSEWKKRQWMLDRFSTYLESKSFKNVLDIGCGNGWMTHQVHTFCSQITGIDVGREELEQAARCFPKDDIHFTCCSDWSLLPKHSFDLIYFAGSFHYFESNPELWERLFWLLAPGGEIHILETQFYSSEEVAAARQRTRNYFQKMGHEGQFYKHLAFTDLPEQAEKLYKPTILNKVMRNRSPFPWIRIKGQ